VEDRAGRIGERLTARAPAGGSAAGDDCGHASPSAWVTPDDLWRDRLAVLADQGAWLAAWGPRPGEPDCRVPPALLPESQTRRENAYLLWRSTVPTSPDVISQSKTTRKPTPRSRRRDDTEQATPARPSTRRGKSHTRAHEPNNQQD
jgi:hypothetical protein